MGVGMAPVGGHTNTIDAGLNTGNLKALKALIPWPYLGALYLAVLKFNNKRFRLIECLYLGGASQEGFNGTLVWSKVTGGV
jgi:hypothetical protein